MERDLRKKPYTEDEGRVCDYLQKIAPDIGCGDDPIGFLIASHDQANAERRAYRARLTWEDIDPDEVLRLWMELGLGN